MSTELTPEQHDAVTQAGTAPVRVIDPQSQTTYVILRADVYEQVRGVLDERFDIRDAYPLMDAVARAAGWDDSAEDIYNDLDPRRSS